MKKNSYYYKKLLLMLIFSNNEYETFNMFYNDITNKEFLIVLMKFINDASKRRYLNDFIKNKTQKLLDYISQNSKYNTRAIQKKLKISDEKFDEFISDEIIIRTDNMVLKDYLNNEKTKVLAIYESLGNEFNVYQSHFLEKDIYFDFQALDYVISHKYFDALNVFLKDNKKIILNRVFLKKMCHVFQKNNEIFTTNMLGNVHISYDEDILNRQLKFLKKLKKVA